MVKIYTIFQRISQAYTLAISLKIWYNIKINYARMDIDKNQNRADKWLEVENRVVYKYSSAPEKPAPGSEVLSKHEALIKAIERNISLNPKRYKQFEKGKVARALLLAILKKRAKLHPDNISGLTKNNPNLDLIALTNSNNEKVLKEAEIADRKIRVMRGEYAAKANDIYNSKLKSFNADFFGKPQKAWPNIETEKGKIDINGYLKGKGKNNLTKNPFAGYVQSAGFRNMNRFFQSIQKKEAIKPEDLTSFKSASAELRLAFPMVTKSIQVEKENIGLIKNILVQLDPKKNTEAQKYLEFLVNKRMPALMAYKQYLEAVNQYFAILEYTEYENLAKNKATKIDMRAKKGAYKLEDYFKSPGDYLAALTAIGKVTAGLNRPPKTVSVASNMNGLLAHNASDLRQYLVRQDPLNKINGLINLNVFRLDANLPGATTKKSKKLRNAAGKPVEIATSTPLTKARNNLDKNGIRLVQPSIQEAIDFKGLNSVLADTSEGALRSLNTLDVQSYINDLNEHSNQLLFSVSIDSSNINVLNSAIIKLVQKTKKTAAETKLYNNLILVHDILVMRRQYYKNLQRAVDSKIGVLHGMINQKNALEGKTDKTLSPAEKIRAYRTRLSILSKDIAKTKRLLENARKAGNHDQASFYSARLEVLNDGKLHLKRAYLANRTGAEGYLENAYKVIDGKNLNNTSNLQVAMEEYMAVRKELINRGKLPDDPDTQSLVIAAAMLGKNGIDGVLDKKFISPNFKINTLKRKPFNYKEMQTEAMKKALLDSKGDLISKLRMKGGIEHAFLSIFTEKELNNNYSDFENKIKNLSQKFSAFHNEIKKTTIDSNKKGQSLNNDLDAALAQARKTDQAFKNHINLLKANPFRKEEDIKKLENARKEFRSIANQLTKIQRVPSIAAYYSETEENQIGSSASALNSLSKKLETGSRPQDVKVDRNSAVIYQILQKTNPAFLKKLIENGSPKDAEKVMSDIRNYFVGDFNKGSRIGLEKNLGIRANNDDVSSEKLHPVVAAAKENLLEGIVGLEAMARAQGVTWEGAFEAYWKLGYYSNPKKNVSIWEADLEAKLKEGKGREAVAIQVLSQIMASTDQNKVFLDALANKNDPGHKNARRLLKSFIEDFKKRTKFSEKANEIRTAYNEAINEKKATVTSKVMRVVRQVVGGIFDSGQPIERRIMYGAAAYLFIFKGVLSKNSTMSKIAKWGGGALLASMLYEDITKKSILGSVGMESPFEYSKGTILNRMAIESGIENNDKKRYRALQILHTKSVEDTLRWYDKRGHYDNRPENRKTGKSANISMYRSLTSSRLVSSSELDSIDPTADDQESNALIFKDVIEKQLIAFGKKASPGEDLSKEKLIQRGRDFLYHHYTITGLKSSKRSIDMLSPYQKQLLAKGATHKPTWEEVSGAMTTAADIEKSMKQKTGLSFAAAVMADSLKWLDGKVLKPAWFHISDWTTEKAAELKQEFLINYGPKGWEAMEKLGSKGWQFMRTKAGELKVWWKNSHEAVRLRRTGSNLWEIVKTGVKIPWALTAHAAEWGSGELKDVINGLDKKRKEWVENERIITYDIFPKRGFAKLSAKAERTRNGLLLMNQIANGYAIFGRFESDFYQTNLKRDISRGILSNKRFNSEPAHPTEGRFKINPYEGYVNFVGVGPRDNPTAAFQDGIKNLVKFLRHPQNYRYIDQTKPEGLKLAQAIRTEDPSLIRETVMSYISRFGAFKTQHNGYLLFLHFPFPTSSKATSYKEKIVTLAGEKEVTRYVKYKNRYSDMYRKKDYPRFEKYKHSWTFSAKEDPLVEGYIESKVVGKRRVPDFKGHYVMQYMKEFNLWTPKQALTLITFALSSADGEILGDYGKNDNKADALFKAIKSRGEVIHNLHLPERNYTETYKTLFKFGSKAVADRFEKYHNYLDEYFSSKSLWTHAKSVAYGPNHFKLEYRRYLMKHLSALYREQAPRKITAKDLTRITQKFAAEKTGIVEDLMKRGRKGLTQIHTLLKKVTKLATFENPAERDIKSQKKRKK